MSEKTKENEALRELINTTLAEYKKEHKNEKEIDISVSILLSIISSKVLKELKEMSEDGNLDAIPWFDKKKEKTASFIRHETTYDYDGNYVGVHDREINMLDPY